jgi:hypothetical protein
MAAREIPFNENETCDYCGAIGAYDFMGDFLCENCTDEYLEEMDDN